MTITRVRFTVPIRLEPIGPQHGGDPWRLFQDHVIAAQCGAWTRSRAHDEAARIGACWYVRVSAWRTLRPNTGEGDILARQVEAKIP